MDNKKAKKRKFNLLDVIIIIAILAIVAFAAYKLLPSETTSSTEKAHVSFYAEELPDFVLEEIYVGAPVMDADRSIFLGVVEDVQSEPYVVYEPDQNGVMVANEVEGMYNVTFTTVLDVTPSAYGVSLSGTIYGVGHTAAVRAGFAKMSVTVSDVVYDDPSVPESLAKAIAG